MILTKRDLNLFKLLSNYAMLTTKQIKYLCFNGIALSTVLRRLRVLEKNKFILRLIGLESKELLWTLQDKGGVAARVEIAKRHWSKNLLEHDYKLLSLRLILESSHLAHSWLPEHQIRSSIFKRNDFRLAKEKLIPDAIMGIEFENKKLSLAIELELTLKNKDKLRKTLRRYKEQAGVLGVWYIASTQAILNAVQKIWSNLIGYQSSPKLYLSRLDDLMSNPLSTKVFGDGGGALTTNLWTLMPAHPPAQQVSSETIENELKIYHPTYENNLENKEVAA